MFADKSSIHLALLVALGFALGSSTQMASADCVDAADGCCCCTAAAEACCGESAASEACTCQPAPPRPVPAPAKRGQQTVPDAGLLAAAAVRRAAKQAPPGAAYLHAATASISFPPRHLLFCIWRT